MSNEAANYNFDHTSFAGTPQMLMNKGTLVLSQFPGTPLTSISETAVGMTMLPLKLTVISDDNIRLEWQSWRNGAPNRAITRTKCKRQRISTYNLECNRFKLTPSNSMYGVQNDQPKTPRQLAADYYPMAAI